MRLDELVFDDNVGDIGRAVAPMGDTGYVIVWRFNPTPYTIRTRQNSFSSLASATQSWDLVDPVTAQAVLFELFKQ